MNTPSETKNADVRNAAFNIIQNHFKGIDPRVLRLSDEEGARELLDKELTRRMTDDVGIRVKLLMEHVFDHREGDINPEMLDPNFDERGLNNRYQKLLRYIEGIESVTSDQKYRIFGNFLQELRDMGLVDRKAESIPNFILRDLLKSKHPRFRYFAARLTKLTPEITESIINDPDMSVRHALLQNKDCDGETAKRTIEVLKEEYHEDIYKDTVSKALMSELGLKMGIDAFRDFRFSTYLCEMMDWAQINAEPLCKAGDRLNYAENYLSYIDSFTPEDFSEIQEILWMTPADYEAVESRDEAATQDVKRYQELVKKVLSDPRYDLDKIPDYLPTFFRLPTRFRSRNNLDGAIEEMRARAVEVVGVDEELMRLHQDHSERIENLEKEAAPENATEVEENIQTVGGKIKGWFRKLISR